MSQINYKAIKERIIWIDSLRAIAIFYVVLGHAITTFAAPAVYNKYVYSFHLPLFFFVSGYLFNIERNPNFRFFLKKRVKTLLIPYFVFTFFAYIFVLASQYFNLVNLDYSFEGINGLVIIPVTKVLYSSSITPFNNPLWFLTYLL